MAKDGSGANVTPGVFDFARLTSISDGDTSFERELAGEYLAQAHKLLDQIAEGLESSDVEAVRRDAHLLKGSSMTVGAVNLGALGAELELIAGHADPMATAAVFALAKAGIVATERTLDAYFGSDAYRKAA